MLVLWMGYSVAVAALLVGAGALIEDQALARRRWIAAAALLLGFAIPLARPAMSRWLPQSTGIDVVFGPIAPVLAASAGSLQEALASSPAVLGLQRPLMLAWMMASLVLVAFFGAAVLRLMRDRRHWRADTLDGVPVLVSRDLGPAVVGLRRPQIVVPSWVFTLSSDERALILAHEEEHLRRGDPALIAGAALLPLIMPWNPGLWWGLARLRHAVEADCDARVLGRGLAGSVSYSRLLLNVGARAAGAVPLGAGFGERASSLERRIRDMLERTQKLGWRGWAVRLGIAAVLVVAACTLEVNINTGGDDEAAGSAIREGVDAPPVERIVLPPPSEPAPEVEVEAPPPPAGVIVPRIRDRENAAPPVPPTEPDDRSLREGPTFTPFTVAPSILNRMEVIQAMEAEYPRLLRDAGVGGTVRVYFFISAEGVAEDVRIDKSSGHPALDDAAVRVGSVYRFSPALNKDQKVPVWVSFPITFQVR